MPFSFLEIFGVTLAIIIILLDTRQSVLARPLSLLGTSISLYFYYSKGLYAKGLSNCIFMVLHVYGWYYWQYGGKNKTPLSVSKTPRSQLVTLAVMGLLGGWVLGSLFAHYSSAVLPYWDSLHTAMVIIAYWLLVKKKLETWVVWLFADILYAVLLYSRGIYLFSGLYAFYTILVIHGYLTWRRSYRLGQATGIASH